MDEPNLKEAVKKDDMEDITNVLSKLNKKVSKENEIMKTELEHENEFAEITFGKVHMFYGLVVIQTIIMIVLGTYQIIVFKKKLNF